MADKDKWLKWYEGQPVSMTFEVKHEDLIKLMECKEIKVRSKGETFVLKKYTGKVSNKVGRPKKKSPKKRKTSKKKKVVKKL